MEALELDDKDLKQLIEMVHQMTGITMAEHKKTLLQGRLRPRLRELKITSFLEYIRFLKSNKEEAASFINLVTTNETSFFRTPKVWEFFNKDFLPKWIAAHPKNKLKIWSGAASTGEEIYSIGISCQEFKAKNPLFDYQILGTDINTEVLEKAEKGIYSGRSIEAFKTNQSGLFNSYLQKVQGEETSQDYRVTSTDVRARIKFGTHNLFTPPPGTETYDIVFLRNVLIYFEKKDQEIVLNYIEKSLVKGGTLILGESESLGGIKTNFQFLSPLIYEKKVNP